MIFLASPNKSDFVRFGKSKLKKKIKFDNNGEFKTINPIYIKYLKQIYPIKVEDK